MAAVFLTRQPFGELGPAQLQQLSSTKNCQNAITNSLSKPAKALEKAFPASPSKRNIDLTIFDDDEDSENVDPASFQSKRAKNFDGMPSKKPNFVLPKKTRADQIKTVGSSPETPGGDNYISTSSFTRKRKVDPATDMSTPLSAPAGRSPKHKRIGILSKKRNSLSSFRRIDPPAFGKTFQGNLSFSIDEALSGTISSHSVKAKLPTLEEYVPKSWLFDIHEDTPEEEAANLMEHSACTLDISDDEGQAVKNENKGKENIPPLDHPQQDPTSPLVEKAANSRLVALVDAMLDEGEDRRPLGDLPAVDFYDEGLHADSKVIIALEEEKHDVVKPILASGTDVVEMIKSPMTTHVAAPESDTK